MSELVGNIGDDTPFWRSQYVYGDEDMPVLMYNEDFTLQSDSVFAVDSSGNIHSISISDGSLDWSNDTADDLFSMWLASDRLFTYGLNGSLRSLNTTDGSQNWSSSPTSNPGHPPVYHNGNVYVPDNGTYSVDANNGSTMWSNSNGDSIIALSSSNLFISEFGTLHSYSRSDGSENWNFTPDFDLTGSVTSPLYIDGTVYCGDSSGRLHSINASNGSQNWKYNLGFTEQSAFISYESNIIYGSYWTDSLFAYDVANQTEIWRKNISPEDVLPAIDENNVYTRDSTTIYSHSKTDGSQNWTYNASADASSELCVTKSLIIYGNQEGDIVAINKDDGTMKWTYFGNDNHIVRAVDMEQTVWSYSNREGVTP